MPKNKEIAQQWFHAFNTHDIELLLSLYDDQAEHYSPKLKLHQPESRGIIKGKTALRTWWTDAFSRLPRLTYEPIGITSEDDRFFMEYIRHNPGEDDLRVAELLVLQNGIIIASRVYHS